MKKMALCVFMILVLLAACQPETVVEQIEVTRVVTETVEMEGEPIEVTRLVEVDGTGDTGRDTLERQIAPDAPVPRLIIKRGDMAITVEDTDETVGRVTELAVNSGGYVINQQIWEQDGHRFAMLEFALPVDDFEQMLAALRTLGQVTSETATGQDVTEEYVDLESRLANLRATQERLRELLAQAEDVEAALAVSNELSNVEEELEVVLGRMEYLSNRAAFSTIHLTISPVIPTPTPQPSPSPTPWRPGETAQEALATLEDTTRQRTNGLIRFTILWCPWLLLAAVFGYLFYRIVRWWGSRRLQTV